MVLLTFLIATVNVVVGYALAVHLGYGPPGLAPLHDVLAIPRALRLRLPSKGPVETPTMDTSEIQYMLDDEADEEIDTDLSTEAYDAFEEEEVSYLNVGDTESWDLDEKYVETSILKLNIAMIKSGARACEIDTLLRKCEGNTDAETVHSCHEQLKEDCETYLSENAELTDKFRERIEELGELQSLGEEIDITNMEQAAQVETTLNNLNMMDFESDLEAANLRLREEIKNLRGARHKLRDNQEAAFITIAKYENRLDKVEPTLFDDPLTRLPNRIGLEATMAKWWSMGRHKTRQMSVALIDIDAFAPLNEFKGILTADKILSQLARYIGQNVNKGDFVARYSGQQFMVISMDLGPRAAIKNLEVMREQIGEMEFLNDGEAITISTGNGYTEVFEKDTPEKIFKRMEDALRVAKENGPNHAATTDGEETTLVDSPGFGSKKMRIEL